MAGAALRGDLLDALRRLAFPIAAVDSEGRVSWQNDSMKRLVGERVGRRFGEPVVAEDRQRFREAFLQTLSRREPRDMTLRLMTVDGDVLRGELSAAPLMEDGHAVGVFGVLYPAKDPSYVPPQQARLTPRQQDVLVELARGCSTDGIARMLGISPETVRNHLREIFRRLGVHSRVGAVVRAHELGLV
jgi:PAS domain S-box-containing protein